jgi:hypothetical protein
MFSPLIGGAAETQKVDVSYERTNRKRGSGPIGQNLPEIVRFYTLLDGVFLHETVVVADTIHSLVASFAELKIQEPVKSDAEERLGGYCSLVDIHDGDEKSQVRR